MGYEYFWHGGMWIFPLIFILIILFMFSSGKFKSPCSRLRGDDTPKKEESALEILKKRYAKGEISKEEYLEMKDTLS